MGKHRKPGMREKRLKHRGLPRCKATGKVRFRSKIAALIALAGPAGERGSVRVYYCRLCTGWHTTSQPYSTPIERMEDVTEAYEQNSEATMETVEKEAEDTVTLTRAQYDALVKSDLLLGALEAAGVEKPES